jgi:hypothetical protein
VAVRVCRGRQSAGGGMRERQALRGPPRSAALVAAARLRRPARSAGQPPGGRGRLAGWGRRCAQRQLTHCRRGVLQLHVLVPHERPGRQVAAAQLEGAPVVLHRLLPLPLDGVVVADDAARLGPAGGEGGERVGLQGTANQGPGGWNLRLPGNGAWGKGHRWGKRGALWAQRSPGSAAVPGGAHLYLSVSDTEWARCDSCTSCSLTYRMLEKTSMPSMR